MLFRGIHSNTENVYCRERSELVKVVAMLATASVPDDRDNGNAWTRRFVTEMEKLAAPLLNQ
jgi:hypothetical protein